ncbi:MAG: type I glutamate--ammonia ligase [Phycisphaerales bacterium]|nr:MAG: type I glutamate--ammonia ligase [Phycisphaerales bacterium]
MFASAFEALKYIADHEIDMVDLKVAGVGGQWLHITIPAGGFNEAHFRDGVGYDGSAGSGFGRVESGDVAARPEPDTAFIDPFCQHPTIGFICETVTADTKEPIAYDPRTIARKAVQRMRDSGIADQAWMAPEYEFHIFDRVELTDSPYETSVRIHCSEIDSREAPAIPVREGYLRVPPSDRLQDLRSEIALTLGRLNIPVRYHHHEVGAPGQCEIEVDLNPLLLAADQAMIIKYVIKNIARRHGKVATFMPKPIHGEAGNGMHVHQRLTKDGEPLFYDQSGESYAGLSPLARQYIGGLLMHGRALTGLTNPSTNSFKRLVGGYEAPVNLFYSLANRSAAIRVPRYTVAPDDKRIEYRPPDATANVYMLLAAMLMAGLDGIESKVDPAEHDFGPFDVDIARQDSEFRRRIVALPRSLHDALDALEEDFEFLTRDGVFPESFIRAWIAAKRKSDHREVASRPHPHEYYLYLDA